MQGTVIVFDFDETIIDCDSDQWIAGDFGAADFFNNLLKSMSWNAASIRMMREFHAQGRSIDEITKSLKKIPLSPHIVATIKSAHALGCELRVLSDANTFFIETVFKHHGISDCFSEICTNPSFVDEEGKLIISPYHDNSICPHSCTLCPPNMCKGIVIAKISELICSKGKKRIIYVGDGKGDYCPSLRLGKSCIVMPRTNYPLWKLLHDNTNDIEAKIHEWGDYFELKSVLLGLLEPVSNSASGSGSVNDNNDCVMTLISPDCKSDAVPPEFLIGRV